ncbi:MAG: hypothetical protein FWE03_02820 [Firmicutes bacterium]|nr:hypothetical protein [Bacillota bacterium]
MKNKNFYLEADKILKTFIMQIKSAENNEQMLISCTASKLKGLKGQREEFEKLNSIKENEDGIIFVAYKQVYEYNNIMKEIDLQYFSQNTLISSMLVSLFSFYESFLSKLLKMCFINKPELIRAIDKNLKYSDLEECKNDFLLAKNVLMNDYNAAYKLMKKLGNEDENLKLGYSTWPLFNEFRKEIEFKQTYREVYNEDFDTTVKEVEPPEYQDTMGLGKSIELSKKMQELKESVIVVDEEKIG